MSYTIMANPITGGTRRLQTLGGWGLGGAPSEIAQQMIAEGYDSATINILANANATDAMLQNLWDNTAAGSQEFADAANQLLSNLTHGPGGAASAPGYPKGAIPQIQTDFGMWDLSLRSTWDEISGLFNQAASGLNAIAARNPNDPSVIQMRARYNDLAKQFSSVWATVFSGAAPVQTLGAWQDLAAAGGIVIIGGVAILGGAAIGIVAAISALAAGLWTLLRWIESQMSQTAVSQTQADVQSQLAKSLAIAQAKGDTATAQQILATMRAAGGQSAPTNWSAWLQQNFGLILLGLGAIVIGPQLVKKI